MGWLQEYGRSYATREEFDRRFTIFKENAEIVSSHNGHELALNQFADWSEEEYAALLGYKPEIKPQEQAEQLPVDDLPESIDWSSQGAVSDIKDQGRCGSCWAFSTTGSIESAQQIASGNMETYSE